MGEENRSLLEEEIKAEIKRLGSLESGSQEHTTAVDSLTKLYKLKLEEDKNTYERLDKIENREIDQESKTAQMAESVKDRYFRFGMAAAELVLPLMFYGVWMKRGFKFEQDGTFTSQTFRGLFSRFRLRNKPVPKAESSCIQHVLFVFLLLEIYKGYCERCKSAFYLLIKY